VRVSLLVSTSEAGSALMMAAGSTTPHIWNTRGHVGN
jgi:hypothetical protein